VKEPYWFSLEECLAVHDMILSQYGGATGLRDEGLLESALARPLNRFSYGETDLCVLAASYASGIILNHPLVDGNKRTGFMLGAAFLERNGLTFTAAEADAVMQTLSLAAGDSTEEDYATWLQSNSR